jgi:hypothetical protein
LFKTLNAAAYTPLLIIILPTFLCLSYNIKIENESSCNTTEDRNGGYDYLFTLYSCYF